MFSVGAATLIVDTAWAQINLRRGNGGGCFGQEGMEVRVGLVKEIVGFLA